MNDDLQKQLLEWAQKTITAGETYLPQVVNQYITWKVYENIFCICLGVLILLIGLGAYIKESRIKDDDPYRDRWNFDDGRVLVTTIIMIFSGVIGGICTLDSTFCLIKLKIAPAVFIIDKLTAIK